MAQSWIRKWFQGRSNFELWAIFLIWWIIQFTVALTILTAIAKLVFLKGD